MLYVSKKSKLSFSKIIKAFFIGTLPATLWEIFSIYYFGFPFPNTYYAKQYSGNPFETYYFQKGILYIKNFGEFDPFSFFIICYLLLFQTFRKNYKWTISLGIVFYICYIIYVGGDFMSGRFFVPVIFISILKLKDLRINILNKIQLFFVILLGISNIFYSRLYIDKKYQKDVFDNDICNERMYYFENFNIKKAIDLSRQNEGNFNWHFDKYQKSHIMIMTGYNGILEGPNTYVIDKLALNQVLLARLPQQGYNRIGHIERNIPYGYQETIDNGKNVIRNKEIHDYYDHIKRVIRGNLNSKERFKSIFYLNFIKKKLPLSIINDEDY